MVVINFIGALFAVIIGCILMLSQSALWQRKEYRLDRVRSHIQEPSGSPLGSPWLLLGMTAVGAGWVAYLVSKAQLAELLGGLSLVSYGIHYMQKTLKQGVDRPKWTAKAGVLFIGSLVALCAYIGLFFTPIEIIALQSATILLFIPVIIAVVVGLVNLPFWIRKKQIIKKATSLRQSLKNITVIGITGSYGKTSVKHFSLQILQDHMKGVQATKEHRNSEIGVAIDMLESLSAKTKVYIAEMGAYRKGEIKALVKLAQPKIGLITAVSNQHLSLFGSKQELLKAKWELADGVLQNGTLIINRDDAELRQKSAKVSGEIMTYDTVGNSDISVHDTQILPEVIKATIRIKDEKSKVVIPLAGKGALSSVLGAVALTHAVGLSLKDISASLEKLQAFPRTMQLVKKKDGSTILDDSYSGGQVATQNAFEHFTKFTQADKRVVFTPIIELGSDGPTVHEQLGELFAGLNARIYVWGVSYKKELEEGIKKSGKQVDVSWYVDPLRLAQDISRDLSQDTAILIEGRVPDIVRRGLGLTK